MKTYFPWMKNLVILSLVGCCFTGCTQVVTAPIAVTGAVAEAGIHMVGAAGGAVVDTVSGGSDNDED